MFNEPEVIKKVLAGDMKAFEMLVGKYEKLVFALVKRMVTNSSDIEDVCQEVFLKVFKNMQQFKQESSLSTWIARIAYYTAINHLKKHARQQLTGGIEAAGHFHFEESADRLVLRKDLGAHIQRLLEQMPPQYKAVLTLYHLNEFSYNEITEITGMPEGTVKGVLFRARKLLKDKVTAFLKPEDYGRPK